MQNITPAFDWLFESSWEVCNKIGGIYTVLSTKAKALQDLCEDRTVFIGPDVWTDERPCPCFKEYKSLLKNAATRVALPYGMSIRVGRWQIPGKPLAVLVYVGTLPEALPEIYGEMWQRYGVDSLHAYGDYSEGCAFGVASAIVLEALASHLKADLKRTIAHFDEWTTSMGLLYLESHKPEIATVFTTHATSIGRSICSNGKPLYDYFEGYHGDQMARELNMESKHSLEKSAAHHADCFTTVSEVTARECRQLLEINPQVVTPNGFEPGFVPTGARYAEARRRSRRRLLDIASALAGRELPEDSLIVATSGRNEYRNKGIDLYIDALAQAGHEHPARQIVAFIMVPAWSAEPVPALVDSLNGKGGEAPQPNFVTHRLHNEDSDPAFRRLASAEGNQPGANPVFVFVPCYLDGHDGVVNLAYYEMMPGLDLTVFPSYYEPWGYTPLESIAFGVPTVTTDKAGFGRWIEDNFPATFGTCGAEVVERTDSNYPAAAAEIAHKVRFMAECGPERILGFRHNAQRTALQADWHSFIKYYLEAYKVAFERRDQRIEN